MMLEKISISWKYQIGRLLPRIEEDGGSWLRRPKLYKRVVEPHKKKVENYFYSNLQTECGFFNHVPNVSMMCRF
jgi:hypothetical protein